MESEFFRPIDWASIYDRGAGGPWIPPEEPLLVRKRKETMRQINADDDLHIDGWEEQAESLNNKKLSKDTELERKYAVPTADTRKVEHKNDKTFPDNSENDQSELLHVRDSIFATSTIPQENRIQDWSFVDTTTLGQAVSSPDTSNTRRGNAILATPSGKKMNRL